MPAKRSRPTPPIAIPIIAGVPIPELFLLVVVVAPLSVLDVEELDEEVGDAPEEDLVVAALPLVLVVRLSPVALAPALALVIVDFWDVAEVEAVCTNVAVALT